MKRLFLTGSNGFLGGNLCRLFFGQPTVSLFATQRSDFSPPLYFSLGNPTHRLDLTSETEVWNVISQLHPDCIIHTAAQSDPTVCEIKPEEAEFNNRYATETIAKVAGLLGIRVIYLSTDLVFDGEGTMYRDTDETNPLSVYGRTKREGELAVMKYCENYAILRTTIMLGDSPRGTRSVNESIALHRREGRIMSFFSDEFRTPTSAKTVSKVIQCFATGDLIEAKGIYHAVGNERLSRYDFGARVAQKMGIEASWFKAVSLNDIHSVPKRPKDVSLSNETLKAILPFAIPTLDEELHSIALY